MEIACLVSVVTLPTDCHTSRRNKRIIVFCSPAHSQVPGKYSTLYCALPGKYCAMFGILQRLRRIENGLDQHMDLLNNMFG